MKDHCTKEGATDLMERIQRYWADRGFAVNLTQREAGFVPAMRSCRTDIRSDMLNGRPRIAPTPRVRRAAS